MTRRVYQHRVPSGKHFPVTRVFRVQPARTKTIRGRERVRPVQTLRREGTYLQRVHQQPIHSFRPGLVVGRDNTSKGTTSGLQRPWETLDTVKITTLLMDNNVVPTWIAPLDIVIPEVTIITVDRNLLLTVLFQDGQVLGIARPLYVEQAVNKDKHVQSSHRPQMEERRVPPLRKMSRVAVRRAP